MIFFTSLHSTQLRSAKNEGMMIHARTLTVNLKAAIAFFMFRAVVIGNFWQILGGIHFSLRIAKSRFDLIFLRLSNRFLL